MFFIASIIGAIVVQGGVARRVVVSSSDLNPWNDFQSQYGGYSLRSKEAPLLYRWRQRKALENRGLEIPDIIDKFRAAVAEYHNNEDELEEQSLTASEVNRYASLNKLEASDLKAQLATVVGSPLAIARTLYSVILSHMPKAQIGEQYHESDRYPFVDFIRAFRKGSRSRRLTGIEQRVREWVEMLHDATKDYYAAKGTGKGVATKFVSRWKHRNAKKEAKDALKVWLDSVTEELHVLAGQEADGVRSARKGEVADVWVPMMNRLETQLGEAYSNMILADIQLAKPINQTLVTDASPESSESTGNGWVDWLLGRNEPSASKVKRLTTLDEAYEFGLFDEELEQMQGSLEDLRVCFIELSKQLDWVQQNFHDWKAQALQGAGELQRANIAWARSSWDDLGIEIPGDESPQSKRLKNLQGVVVMPRLSGSSDTSKVGFAFAPSAGINHDMLNMIVLNVNNLLSGADIVQMIQLEQDAGDILKLEMTSPAIPSIVPTSAKTFTFAKVDRISLFQPGLGEVCGLSQEVIEKPGTTWYMKTMTPSWLSQVRKAFERIDKETEGNASPAQLKTQTGRVLGEMRFMHGTLKALARIDRKSVV